MGSDAPAPQTQESMDQIMVALTKNLPAFMQVANAQVLPQAQAELTAAQSISEPYQQLLTNLYQKFAPQMAQVGAQTENINRTAAAKTDLDILRGSGGDLVKEAQLLDQQLNPETYAVKSQAASQLGKLLAGVDIDGGTHEAERLVNREAIRSGNAATPSAISTVGNALAFGDERLKRMDALANSIGQATAFIQGGQGQFNPVQTALNRPSNNVGESRFGGITAPNQTAYQMGSNMLNNATNVRMQQNDINANRRDSLDRFNETLSGIGSIVSI